HYSHVRLDAKRKALDGLSGGGSGVGYDTKHDTNPTAKSTANPQGVENIGGRDRDRTGDLLVAGSIRGRGGLRRWDEVTAPRPDKTTRTILPQPRSLVVAPEQSRRRSARGRGLDSYIARHVPLTYPLSRTGRMALSYDEAKAAFYDSEIERYLA